MQVPSTLHLAFTSTVFVLFSKLFYCSLLCLLFVACLSKHIPGLHVCEHSIFKRVCVLNWVCVVLVRNLWSALQSKHARRAGEGLAHTGLPVNSYVKLSEKVVMCVYLYLCLWIYVCIWIYIYLWLCEYLFWCVSLFVCLFVRLFVRLFYTLTQTIVVNVCITVQVACG